MKFKVRKDPIEKGNILFNKTMLEINPGVVSCIVGCNGSGKTTLVREIKEKIKDNGGEELKNDLYYKAFANLFKSNDEEKDKKNIYFIDFDKNVDTYNKEEDYFFNRMEAATSSTGEGIMQRAGRICYFIGQTIRNLEEGSQLYIFMDDCDAGTSIDMINDIKAVFPLIIKDSQRLGLDIYIITTANSFEFCKDCDCISVHDFKHKQFRSYETFKKFVLKSRELKENRGW